MSKILDSGVRRVFTTGAERDIPEGKGRCDLLPLQVIGNITHDKFLNKFHDVINKGNTEYLVEMFCEFAKTKYGTFENAILDVAVHYEDGCRKYGDRNWEKGIPLHSFIDSAIRHYLKHKRGDTDERHDRAFLWNLLGALWTLKNKPELNDLPYKKEED